MPAPRLKDLSQTAGLVGLFDVNASRLKAANDLLGVRLPVFTDFDQALQDLDPDGVIIATRDSTPMWIM
jgi:predicted dehydrogenase